MIAKPTRVVLREALTVSSAEQSAGHENIGLWHRNRLYFECGGFGGFCEATVFNCYANDEHLAKKLRQKKGWQMLTLCLW